MSYLTKEEVLRKFFIESPSEDVWELYFREGGRTQRVAIYYDQDDVADWADEDALSYWMRVLHRTWSDEDGTFEEEKPKQPGTTVLKFKGEFL